ncbi:MAG: hypothetical protein M3340_14205 [Actinomycetota bacterium]|nr:hypothetical protein [Actinomycetota bacterium]
MTGALAATGHAVVRGLVHRQLAQTLYNMLLLREFRGEGRRDEQVPTAFSFWGDSTLDGLLLTLRPEIERVAGCSLLPTYCYARVYRHGDSLARHRDRPAAEIAATIHLGSSGGEPPPIRFAPDFAVRQEPGDGVVYLGSEVEHWREAFAGQRFGQVFVNYVRAEGEHRHHAYDGRHDQFPAPAELSRA